MNKKDRRKIRTLTGLLVLVLVVVGSFVSTNAASAKLNKKKATVTVGKTVKLKVKNTGSKVKWTSSNKKVATVKKSGKYGAVVKGKKAGKATITAKVGSKKLKCKVTVQAGLNKTSVTLQKGKSTTIRMLGINKTVKWTSSKPSVVTVKKTTKYQASLTAKKAGTATITAKVGAKKYKCKVTVKTSGSSSSNGSDKNNNISAAAERKISDAVNSVTNESMTDQEKALNLALYVCDNLEHFYGSFYYGDPCSTEECITTGKGIDLGYAKLYIALLEKAGIKSRWIPDNCGGLRNKVVIDGQWYNVDVYHMDSDDTPSGSRNLCYGYFLFSDQEAFKYHSRYYSEPAATQKVVNPDATSTRFDFVELVFNKAKDDDCEEIWFGATPLNFASGIMLYKYNPWYDGTWKNY